jgi:hypothetical protein
MQKTADTLERGDVIRPFWPRDRSRWVVIEPSDHVTTAPPDCVFDGVPARLCCEPRIRRLGPTGRASHICTYVIWPNKRKFTVNEFLDLDTRSAVPEPAINATEE